MDSLSLSTALAGVLSGKDGRKLTVRIDGKPRYDKDTDTMYLPGLPIGEVDEETREDLRAYLAHESGERGVSTWSESDPRWKGKKGLQSLLNGMSDAMVDRRQLEEWPGAGLSILSRVRKDWQRVQKSGGYASTDMGSLAHCLRMLGDRVTTVDEVKALDPQMGEVLDYIKPALDSVDWDSQESIIESAMQIYQTLRPEEMPEPEPDKGEGEDDESEDESDSEDSEESEGEGKGKAGDSKAEVGKEADGEAESKDGESGDGEDANGGEATGKAGAGGTEYRDFEARPTVGDGRGYIPTEAEIAKRLEKGLSAGVPKPKVYTSLPDQQEIIDKGHKAFEWARMSKCPVRSVPEVTNRLVREMRDLLRVEDRALVRRQRFGELDGSKLLNAVVRGEEQVMQKRGRDLSESLAVYVSMDMTGSMGSNIKYQNTLALCLNEALGKLQVPSKFVGWHSTGYCGVGDRESVVQQHTSNLFRFKDWTDRWNDSEVVTLLSNAWAAGGNADVDALADGINSLAVRPERRKIMLYMTDGQPCLDWSGHMDHYTATQLLYDAMKNLAKKAEDNGITLIVVGIDMDGGQIELMKGLMGHANVVSIAFHDMAREVSTVFLKQLKKLVLEGKRGKAWT